MNFVSMKSSEESTEKTMKKPKNIDRETWSKFEGLLTHLLGNSKPLKEDWCKMHNEMLDNSPSDMINSGRIDEVIEFLEMYKENS